MQGQKRILKGWRRRWELQRWQRLLCKFEELRWQRMLQRLEEVTEEPQAKQEGEENSLVEAAPQQPARAHHAAESTM